MWRTSFLAPLVKMVPQTIRPPQCIGSMMISTSLLRVQWRLGASWRHEPPRGSRTLLLTPVTFLRLLLRTHQLLEPVATHLQEECQGNSRHRLCILHGPLGSLLQSLCRHCQCSLHGPLVVAALLWQADRCRIAPLHLHSRGRYGRRGADEHFVKEGVGLWGLAMTGQHIKVIMRK